MRKLLAIVLLSSSFVCAQASSSEAAKPATIAPPTTSPATPKFPEVDAELKDGVYTNRFFGFSVSFPADWKQQDWATLVALARERLKDDPEKIKAVEQVSRMSDPKTGMLLLTTRPDGNGGPIVMLMTQELGPALRNTSPETFVTMATMPLAQMNFTVLVKPEIYKLGDRDFARVEMLSPDKNSQEAMIFAVIKDHALGFVIVGNDTEKQKAYEALKTLKFAKTN